MKGTVIKSTGSWYHVIDEGGKVWECRLRGKIRLDGLRSTNPVAVGDKVIFDQEPGKDTGVIKSIEPRNNVIAPSTPWTTSSASGIPRPRRTIPSCAP